MVRRGSAVKEWSALFWWVFVPAAVLYAVAALRVPVGVLGDDAQNILAAHTLLHGQYVDWTLPLHPALIGPLPGFPLVLAPLVAIIPTTHLIFLKGLTIGCVLAAMSILALLFKSWFFPKRALLILMILLFNPVTLAVSGSVVAGSFTLLLIASALFLLRQYEKTSSIRTRWALLVICAWATLVSPEGFLLPLAIGMTFVGLRQFKVAAFLCIGSLGVFFLWMSRLLMVSGSFVGIFGSSHRMNDTDWPAVIGQPIQTLVWTIAFGVPWTSPWAAPLAMLVVALVALLLLRRGMHLPADRPSQICISALALFAVLYLSFVCLRGLTTTEALWPIFPLLLILLGLIWPSSQEQGFATIAGMLTMIVAIIYGHQDQADIRYAWTTAIASHAPFQTLASHLPSTAFVLTPNPAELTLYTGRAAVGDVQASDSNEFRYRLGENGFTHILLTPIERSRRLATTPHDQELSWSRYTTWMSQDRQAYPVISVESGRVLFAVTSDPDFQKAYQDYLQASNVFHLSQWDQGFSLLDESLRLWPMPEAMNAYGAAALLSGSHLSEAHTYLEQAIARRSHFPLAMVNLARVCQRQGQPELEKEWFLRAEAEVSGTGQDLYLMPSIESGLGRGAK